MWGRRTDEGSRQEPDGAGRAAFHPAAQHGVECDTHRSFISGTFRLAFSDPGRPWGPEATGSGAAEKRG